MSSTREFPISERVRAELLDAGLEVQDVRRVVSAALDEDLRYGPDATTAATVPPDTVATAALIAHEPGRLAGMPVALAVFDAVLGEDYAVLRRSADGRLLADGEEALVLRGNVRGLLTAERTALNVLCHASGIATATALWVSEVYGTDCVIRDSRKTHPGLRQFEKYAVRCGGGANHRLGLGDAILIKDNHVHAAGSVTEALRAARSHAAGLACEVEVDDLDQLAEALVAEADEVLLDNFSVSACASAVRRRDELSPKTTLEASGGLRVDNAAAYARSGVDYLAVGGLTHSSPALDIGMNLG